MTHIPQYARKIQKGFYQLIPRLPVVIYLYLILFVIIFFTGYGVSSDAENGLSANIVLSGIH